MRARAIVLAGVCLVATTGCGIVTRPAATRPLPPSQADRAATGPVPATLPFDLDLSRPVHRRIDVACPQWAGPPDFAAAIPSTARAVAVVTVVAQQATRWNTIDEHRPAQAEALAAFRNSNGRIAPMLWTGWSLRISGPVLRGNLPTTFTAYVEGGKLGDDELDVGSCGGTPSPGATFVAVLGDEIDDQSVVTPRVPMLTALMPYVPATGMVTTPGGVVHLPAAIP